jgi:nitroreductase/FMN reductase [NAD(P)H]
MSDAHAREALIAALADRFGERFDVDPALAGLDELAQIAAHRTHRDYLDRPVDAGLTRLLAACALSAPSKSDLQQCDIIAVRDRGKRDAIADLIPDMPWIRTAPEFLVILANGRRFKLIFELRGRPFLNDHFDAVFYAVAVAAIVLGTFLRAAEAVGLGTCPISVIRDHAAKVSEVLSLPDRVIPLCGLCLGWPSQQGGITSRLSLETTFHVDRFDDGDLPAQLDRYDRRRHARWPYRRQRDPGRWGTAEFYGWSEDKARQYSVPQRTDFGAYVRKKGFRLD